MLRAFVIAMSIALAAPGLALAQDRHDDHRDEHHQGGPPHPGGPPPHPGGPMPGAPHGPPPGAMGGPHPQGLPPGPPPAAMVRPPGPPPGARFTYRGRDIERIHIRPFVYPPGFGYRRWEVGAALPPLFLAREYWYADWAALGMDPPPPGYEWVRYGPDLLLVNIDTGQVVDVAYDVFYD
jgi:Ni/Co efflux regulator RcnB